LGVVPPADLVVVGDADVDQFLVDVVQAIKGSTALVGSYVSSCRDLIGEMI
jgi:hypothetical protein